MSPGVASECIETKDGPVLGEDHFLPELIEPTTGDLLPDVVEGELVLTEVSRECISMQWRSWLNSSRRPTPPWTSRAAAQAAAPSESVKAADGIPCASTQGLLGHSCVARAGPPV